jgi:hypothetical protein
LDKFARLVKKEALAAGVRGDLSEAERGQSFAGYSLRASLASFAEKSAPSIEQIGRNPMTPSG